MKVALILPGAVWFAPFVKIYTTYLENKNIDYSIISWNRDGGDPSYEFQYNIKPKNGHGHASLNEYWKYFKYVRKVLKEKSFDRIIAFCPQTAIMLADVLTTRYKGRYMIDYRDLSIEQKNGFKQIYAYVLKRSCLNVVSSPGFIKCLPKADYLISHNFDVSAVKRELRNETSESSFHLKDGNIKVLTIGGIRDYSSNVQVIDSLYNKEGFEVEFVGRGNSAPLLENHSKEIGASNVSFTGYYKKEDEPAYIKDATFMNIFYPRIITHDTAMSNRFYNSLLHKKPMIVTKNTTQGDFAEKYKIGIAIENCENLELELRNFLENDYSQYRDRCNQLLQSFLQDYETFDKELNRFLGNEN